MLAERYLRRRYKEGREEGREEGRKEGRKEGREELAAEWRAWIKERGEAEAKGEKFDKPPPSS